MLEASRPFVSAQKPVSSSAMSSGRRVSECETIGCITVPDKLQIKSPKPTQVKAVLSAPDGHVRAGDPLIQLFDFEEAKLLSGVQRSIDENQAKLSEVTGDRVQKKLAHLKTIADQRLAALTATQQNFRMLSALYHMGSGDPSGPIRAKHFVSLRTYESLQASLELEIYQRNIADSVKVLRAIDDLLKGEKEYVQTLRARLQIRAPKDGIFRCYVSAGSPVSVGYVLGEIE